jgi:RNase P subunit RPR2
MPLRKKLRKYYRRSWRNFRLELIEKAGGQICSKCGAVLERGINGAHTDHDPRHRRSVVLMCPSCHAKHDAPHRIAIQRRTKAKQTGQQWLTPELEWAPFIDWEIPGWVYDRLTQLPLFSEPGRH